MYKEIDNIKTYFHNFESIESSKKSVLFIAGAGMDHKFVRALNLLKEEFNTPLVIDLPGHGETEGSSKNKIEDYSSFLNEALMDFKISNLTICGYSMGGLIALDLILSKKFPASSLILLNSIAPMMVSRSLVELANKGNCNEVILSRPWPDAFSSTRTRAMSAHGYNNNNAAAHSHTALAISETI